MGYLQKTPPLSPHGGGHCHNHVLNVDIVPFSNNDNLFDQPFFQPGFDTCTVVLC